MSGPTFRGPEVCALADITYRQLDHWARTGLVTPSVCEAKGSGSRRIYSATDVAMAGVIRRLLDDNPMNSRLQLARKIAPIIRSVIESGTPDLVLVITSDDVVVVDGAEHLLAVVREHRAVQIITGFDLPEVSQASSSGSSAHGSDGGACAASGCHGEATPGTRGSDVGRLADGQRAHAPGTSTPGAHAALPGERDTAHASQGAGSA